MGVVVVKLPNKASIRSHAPPGLWSYQGYTNLAPTTSVLVGTLNRKPPIRRARLLLTVLLLVGSITGFRAKPAEAASITDVATVTQQIDNIVKPKTEPSWDELIKPAVLKVEEDRAKAAAQAEAARRQAERIEQERLARLPKPFGTYGNSYAYGQCTWYVASRKAVPGDWGNAGTWFYNAQAQGWATGYSPQVGAIGTTTAGYWGHVVIIEAVEGNNVLVSEMNYNGWNVISSRWAGANEFNYIY